MSPSQLIRRVRAGDRAALSRLVTVIESGEPDAIEEVAAASLPTNRVGITGPPGAGKSTLAAALITEFRSRGESVGVLAVDPSSPLTGGALLGDRIRMQGHIDDPGVYIRSMASRGHVGGLARAAGASLDALSLAGFDWLLVETVGVGQSEVEVMHLVDLVLLVVSPGWGDEVQADKAGVVEIADVFVVNKADRPGVEEVKRALLAVAGPDREVMPTTAATGDGVAALADVITHRLSR